MSLSTPSTSVPSSAAGAHDATSQAALAARRKAFRALHERGCFVIPNPWDVGSARYLQHLGFPALATTSAGFAFSQGLPDSGNDAVVSRDRNPRGPSGSLPRERPAPAGVRRSRRRRALRAGPTDPRRDRVARPFARCCRARVTTCRALASACPEGCELDYRATTSSLCFHRRGPDWRRRRSGRSPCVGRRLDLGRRSQLMHLRWAGTSQRMPVSGQWLLEAGHGRFGTAWQPRLEEWR
jgi:hypothetical protein